MSDDTRCTVLVVEDDDDLRELVQQVLETERYNVTTAADGVAALAVLDGENDPPQLILLDMRMPRMGGAELARELRKRDAAPPPIVVMTAAENASRSAREIAAAGFLEKPFSIEELIATVRRFAPARKAPS